MDIILSRGGEEKRPQLNIRNVDALDSSELFGEVARRTNRENSTVADLPSKSDHRQRGITAWRTGKLARSMSSMASMDSFGTSHDGSGAPDRNKGFDSEQEKNFGGDSDKNRESSNIGDLRDLLLDTRDR